LFKLIVIVCESQGVKIVSLASQVGLNKIFSQALVKPR
jgi:hypothetical protein